MSDNHAPLLSFGLPVRNGAPFIGIALDSILAQDYGDFEVVVSDNASDDGTCDILAAYAQRDSRVRFFPSPENIGQNPNFNRVLELARGKYFRWIGMDDRLDPSYASRCIAEMEAHPEAIGVTTYQMHVDDAGDAHYAEYTGERLDSPIVHRRFRRMVWFMSADYRFIDPIYTLYRRDVLMQSHRLRVAPSPDQVLATELSLYGPIRHIAACLSVRRREPTYYSNDDLLAELYQPGSAKIVRPSAIRFAGILAATVHEFPMSRWSRTCCYAALCGHISRLGMRTAKRRLRNAARAVVPRPLLRRMKQWGRSSSD